MKKSKELNELMAGVEAHKHGKDMRAHVGKLLDGYRRVMLDIGKKDITDPKVKQEASDANLGIIMAEAQLKELQVPPAEFKRLDALHRAVGEQHNHELLAAKAKAFDELVKSQLPFFEGDEVKCREYWRRVQPPHPMFLKFDLARHDHPSGPPAERDIVAEVTAHVGRMGRYTKLLGLG